VIRISLKTKLKLFSRRKTKRKNKIRALATKLNSLLDEDTLGEAISRKVQRCWTTVSKGHAKIFSCEDPL